MSNKQQTAVEWYSNKLMEILGDKCLEFTIEQTMANHYAFKQAKEMEKKQIMNAVDIGFDEGCKFPEDITLNSAKQYYKQTYENN